MTCGYVLPNSVERDERYLTVRELLATAELSAGLFGTRLQSSSWHLHSADG